MDLLKLNFLEGKKSYILSILLVVYAISGLLTGHLTIDQAIPLLGLGGGISTLRKAIG